MATFGTHSGVGSTIALLEAELPQLEKQQLALEEELATVTERLESARAALNGLRSLSPSPLLHDDALAPTPTPADSGVASAPKAAGKRRGAKAAPQPTAPQEPAPEVADAAPARKKAAGRKTAPRAVAATGKPEETGAGAKSAEPTERTAKKTTAGKKTTRRAAKKTAAAKTAEPAAEKSATAVEAAKPSAPRLADSILAYLDTADQPVRAADITQALGREATASSINGVRNVLQRLVKASQARQTGRGLYQKLPS